MSEFYLHKSEGQQTNFNNFHKAWKELKDGWVKITMASARKRSSPQNRYFHGPMLDIVFQGLRDAGFNEIKSKEDAKVVVKSLFLKRMFVSEETGHVIDYIQDTHNLTKEEMNILIEDVIRWGAEYLGVQIPYPGESILIQYQQ